jgi:hypothetical protein
MVIINRGAHASIDQKIKWIKANDVQFTGKISAIIKTTIPVVEDDFDVEQYLIGKVPKKKPKTKNVQKVPVNYTVDDNSVIDIDISNYDDIFTTISGASSPSPISIKKSPKVNNFMPMKSHQNDEYSVQSPISFFKSPIKKNKTKKQNLDKHEDVSEAMINLYDHLKNDIKNKNKYDVLYEIVKCNEAIIKNGILLTEAKINTIISANLKIAELCGINEMENDIAFEVEDMEDINDANGVDL